MQRPPFLPAHLADRLPVWQALSELWLDTELSPSEWEQIARTLADSPYSEAEIAAIHYFEVAPVLWPNLCQVAGKWAGFDRTWLQQACARQASERAFPAWKYALTAWLTRTFTHTDWQAVQDRLQQLRSAHTEI
jgi:hypothetical protein